MDKSLIFLVTTCSGGLGDRLLGIISTYCIAKCLGRKFLIKWDEPSISSVLQINKEYDYYTYNYTFTPVIHNNIEGISYYETQPIERLWESYQHVLIWTNLNIFSLFCNNRSTIPYNEIFLNATMNLFNTIFSVTDLVQNNLRNDLDDAYGIHIRTHDIQWTNPKESQIPYIISSLEKCKSHIVQQPVQKIFITSDCILSFDIAKKIFGEEYTILYNSGEIIHSGHKKEKLSTDGLTRVIVDLISLSHCKCLYLGWHTNFSRFGALLQPARDFYTYEHPTDKHNVKKVDIDEISRYFSWTWRNCFN